MSKTAVSAVLGLLFGLGGAVARADLYQANAAFEKQDLPRAFELYRELAELGHGFSQEVLAVMYVNGEGVKRDNVLGYAWAKLALENGAGDASRGIVSQIEPHLKDGSRARVAEVHAQFGREALLKHILPVERSKLVPSDANTCRMTSAADPDRYFPPEAKRQGIGGSVLMEARVQPDGSVRLPRVWYSFPSGAFDDPGRAVALDSSYRPKTENGVAVACSILFKVKFRVKGPGHGVENKESIKLAAELKEKAQRGDPNAQLAYGVVISMLDELNKDEEPPNPWFLKAAQAGVPSAQYLIGLVLMKGSGFEEDAAKGRFWLEKAAQGGNVDAQVVLASYLLRADDDAATRELGFDWMKRAAGTSHREAKLRFAALLASSTDASRRDPARALALLDEVGNAFDYDPAHFEIRAAALAAQGDFKSAHRIQERAVALARKLRWDATTQKARLAAYEKGQWAVGELIPF